MIYDGVTRTNKTFLQPKGEGKTIQFILTRRRLVKLCHTEESDKTTLFRIKVQAITVSELTLFCCTSLTAAAAAVAESYAASTVDAKLWRLTLIIVVITTTHQIAQTSIIISPHLSVITERTVRKNYH